MNARSEECSQEQGEIVALAGGFAQIRVHAAAACGACASRGVCGSGGGERTIALAIAGPAKVGDTVTLSLPASAPARAALLGYLLPPLCLIGGALIATLLYGGDIAAVAGAALGFGAGLVLVRRLAQLPWAQALASLSCETSACAGDTFSGDHS